ncbi:hypothetical protein I6E50_14120 [Roseburia hominis]|nr:hypothetical protein [Roseburia hominis]
MVKSVTNNLDSINVFKDFDINNEYVLGAVCVLLIIGFASCIQSFCASKIEIVLMRSGDELKRLSLIYIICFFLFLGVNYVFAKDTLFLFVCFVLCVLTGVGYVLLYIINKCGKAKKIFLLYKEKIRLFFIFLEFPIATYGVFIIANIKIISCAILCALVEIIIVGLTDLNDGERNSSITLKIENEKFYIFKRIGKKYLLCGDKNNITLSTKYRLIELDDVVQKKIYFEKENIESK